MMLGSRGSVVIQDGRAHIRWVKSELPPLEIVDGPLVPGRKYGIVGTGKEKLDWGEETVDAKADLGQPFYDLLREAIRSGAPPPVDPRICLEVVEIMERARGQLIVRV